MCDTNTQGCGSCHKLALLPVNELVSVTALYCLLLDNCTFFFFLSELLSFADENIIMCSVCHCNFVKTLHLGASRFLYKLKLASVGCCYWVGLLFKYQLLLLYWSFLLLYCSFYGICYGNVFSWCIFFWLPLLSMTGYCSCLWGWNCQFVDYGNSVCHLGKKKVLDMCSAVNSF